MGKRGTMGGRIQTAEMFTQMKVAIDKLDSTTINLNRTLARYAKTQKKVNTVAKKSEEIAKTRGQASSKLLKHLEREGRELNLLQKNVFKTYSTFREFQSVIGMKGSKTGTVIAGMEYLDLLLTTTNQRIKVFGFEAGTARKVMYGFLPPGMFRIFNQMSTSLRFFSGSLRQIKGDGEEANNIFTTMGKVFTRLPKLTGKTGALQELNPFSKLNRKKKQSREAIAFLEGGGRPRDKRGRFTSVTKQLEGRKRHLEETKSGFQKRKEQYAAIGGKVKETYGELRKKAGLMWQNKSWKGFTGGLMKIVKGAWAMAKMIIRPMITFLIMGMFYLAMISAIIAAFKDPLMEGFSAAWKFIKEAWKNTSAAFDTIWNGITTLWDGLMSGDLMKIIDGVWTIAWGAIQVVIGIGIALLGGLWEFVQAFAKEGLTKLKDFVIKAFTSFDGFKKNFGKALLLIVVIVGLFFSWPVALGIVAVAAIIKLVDKLNIVKHVNTLAAAFAKKLNPLNWFGGGKAEGGITDGRINLVGERGPELVRLPKGSRVHSNSDSRKMMGNSGNTINITINARDTSDSELRRIADKIGSMVNNKINRSSSSRTMG
tara:strand:- start:11 stop:1798 length:1788 start_codon:yes stop_codon:yes gene_type:complete